MKTNFLRAAVQLGVASCASPESAQEYRCPNGVSFNIYQRVLKLLMGELALILIATALAGAQQSPNWQLNVPYLCPDGTSYTITKRAGTGYTQTCWYTQEHNGQFVTNAFSHCSMMIGRLRGCKVGTAANTTKGETGTAEPRVGSLNNTRYDCGAGTIMTVDQCHRGTQDYCFLRLEMNGKFVTQLPTPVTRITTTLKSCKELPPFNPAYLAEFPSAYRVVQGMVVGNPIDNVHRAIGAFYQLSVIMQTLAGGRGLTPDEQKLLGDYSRIQAELEQVGAKKFPSQHFDLASNSFHYGRSDPRFGFEGIPVWTTFLSPSLQSRFAQIVGGDDPRYMAAVEQQKQIALKQLKTEMQVEVSAASMPHDAGTVAMRRCMESGRSDMECLGEGLKTGFVDLAGGNPAKALASDVPAGLRLTGVYAAGPFHLGFDQSAVVVGCGNLVPQSLPYSVERTGFQLLVKIPIQPSPLVLSYRANGELAGPSAIEMAGRVVTGTSTTTSTGYESQKRMMTSQGVIDPDKVSPMTPLPQNAESTHVTWTEMTPVQQQHTVVLTAPKTERCNVGTLPPTAKNLTISGLLTQGLGAHASKSANTAPGLRLGGTYVSPGGLKIEFRGDSATLECGQALNSEGYAVVPEGSQLVVKFENDTGPFSLALQPNGTLTGGGTVLVAGRRIYQTASGQPGYVPLNSRCTVGTLTASK